MQFFAPFRAVAFAVSVFIAAPFVSAEPGSAAVHNSGLTASNIVIGFVGGFVRHTNPRHGPVQIAHRIRQTNSGDAYVEVFENRHRGRAYKTIVRLLDTDRNGSLSAEEKSRAHIVLFGQSWGAAAVVMLARELKRSGIPVSLTVQVDSVAKLWHDDSVIPANVAQAVNFYQPHGILHGTAEITAADPARTQILGNYLFDYKKNPVQCPENLSWADRHLTPSHAASECDPQLWLQVENLVRQHMSPISTIQNSSLPSETTANYR